MIGGFKLHTGSKDKLYNEVYDIVQNYEEDGDKSYLFLLDLYYHEHLHKMGREEMYRTFFERERSSLRVLSLYEILHVRKKAKRPTTAKKFNKVPFISKNMGTLFSKKRK